MDITFILITVTLSSRVAANYDRSLKSAYRQLRINISIKSSVITEKTYHDSRDRHDSIIKEDASTHGHLIISFLRMSEVYLSDDYVNNEL